MHSTSVSLLARVRMTTDQQAWQRFVELYAPLLRNWARRAGLGDTEAADTAQDVMLVLMRELPAFRYDGERGSFRGWLKTIVVNKVRDKQRKKMPVTVGLDPTNGLSDEAGIDDLFEREYQQQVVQRALQIMRTDFEPKTWQACWETTVHRRPAREVGQELGISEASVYVAKSRVLKRLREELADVLD